MIHFIRTDSNHKDFKILIAELDKELKIRDGDDHSYYAQFNKTNLINFVIVAYENEIPAGCGAIKHYNLDTLEIKRMFVPLDKRGKGIATQILYELETWARSLNYSRCILETGLKQPEAIQLYKKNNYIKIPNYDQYRDIENSVCFEKYLL